MSRISNHVAKRSAWKWGAASLFVLAATAALPAEAEVRHYAISALGLDTGTMTVDAKGSDESIAYRSVVNDRGPDVRADLKVDASGKPVSFNITGKQLVNTVVAERFDATDKAHPAGSFKLPATDIPEFKAVLVRALLAAPGRTLTLANGKTVRIEEAATVPVTTPAGKMDARLMLLTGLGRDATPVWVGNDGELFAYLTTRETVIAQGWTEAVPTLRREQAQRLDDRDIAVTRDVIERPTTPVIFRHVRVYDSVAKAMRPDMAVLISGSRITAVGPDAFVTAPADARVIDGAGKTLIPGMWDMHVHLENNSEGLLHLAYGVTTARDMGNDIAAVTTMRRRFASEELAGPRLLLGGLIEGRSPTSAAGVLVSTSEEVSRAITMFADNGYQEIKLYSSFPPKFVPQAAREAHDRGLRLGGHVPAGMDVDDAIKAGYNDISHFYFYLLNFIDGGLRERTNTMVRVLEPAKHAYAIDPKSAAVRNTIAAMRRQDITFDATISVISRLFGDGGKYKGMLATNAEETATYAASEKRALVLLKQLHDSDIRIVAGTDGIPGSGFIDELELYAEAGIPKLDVLSIATLAPAQMMKLDKDLGSIAPGKLADLVLLAGDPGADLSTLRKPVLVMKNGDIYDRTRIEKAIGPTEPVEP